MNNITEEKQNEILSSITLIQYLRQYRKFKKYDKTILPKLIKRDATITICDKGHTPLFYSCELNNIPLELVQSIYYKYPHASILQNQKGYTPLHRAVYHKNISKTLFLIRVNPKAICMQDEDGETPLDLALKYRLYSLALKFIGRIGVCSYLRKCREMVLEVICMEIYKPMEEFLEHVSINQKEILEKIIRVNYEEIVMGDFYNAMNILLQLKYVYGNDQTVIKSIKYDSNEDRYVITYHENTITNWYILHASLQERICPFLYCQLFLYIHPEQVYKYDFNNYNSQLPITYIGRDMTKYMYHYCQNCLRFKGSKQFYVYAADDVICEECKDGDLKIRYLVKFDGGKDLERVRFCLDCLLICPAILRDVRV